MTENIYVDTSVALAELLAEDHKPSPSLWDNVLFSSRLLEYEVWTRLNARGLSATHGDAARDLLGRVSMVELHPLVLTRALDPFPITVRTLDALHLASFDFLLRMSFDLALATYDLRMEDAAKHMGFQIVKI